MSDWRKLAADRPWIVEPGAEIEAGSARGWTRGPVDGLPELSALLARARVTPVVVGGERFELLAWGAGEALRGWLCPEPVEADESAHPVRRRLLSRFGGVREVFGGPWSWWNPNLTAILTADAAAEDFAGMLDAYSWIWEDNGLTVPIRAEDYVAVAVEANGNLTLAERESGRLLLFAPDHSFAGVSVLDGCPEHSLYTIDGIEGLTDWIEAEARAWAAE